MAEKGYTLSEDAATRVSEVVRRVETGPRDEGLIRRRRPGAHDQPALQWVECANNVPDGAGRYAAIWVQYDEQDDTWIDREECYLRPGANGETPVAGQRYLARCQGPHPTTNKPVYVPVATANSGGFHGCAYTGRISSPFGNGGVLWRTVPVLYPTYDRGGYGIYNPLGGYYEIRAPISGVYEIDCGVQWGAMLSNPAGRMLSFRTRILVDDVGVTPAENDRVVITYPNPAIPLVPSYDSYPFAVNHVRHTVELSAAEQVIVEARFDDNLNSLNAVAVDGIYGMTLWIKRVGDYY